MTQAAQTFSAEDRRAYLGASEIAAVLGVDRFKTPLDVYNSKLGLTPDFEGNAHTNRGNRLEAVAAEYYTELTGRKLRRYSKGYEHKEYGFIRGHIDRLVEGQSEIAEIKCPSIGAYRSIQRKGLPDEWQVQMQVYMGLSGHKRAVIIIFCADAWDLLHFELVFDEAIYQPALDAAVSFWRDHVLLQVPPSIQTSGNKPEFELAKHDGTVTVRDDEAFTSKVQLLAEAVQLQNDADALFELAKQECLDVVEKAPGVYRDANGIGFTYAQTAGRSTFQVKQFKAAHPELTLDPFYKHGEPSTRFTPYIKS